MHSGGSLGLQPLGRADPELLARVGGQRRAERLRRPPRAAAKSLDRRLHPLLLGRRVLERAPVSDREHGDGDAGDEQDRRDPAASGVSHHARKLAVGGSRAIAVRPWTSRTLDLASTLAQHGR